MAANVLQWQPMFCNCNQCFTAAINILTMAANVLRWQPMFCDGNQCFAMATDVLQLQLTS